MGRRSLLNLDFVLHLHMCLPILTQSPSSVDKKRPADDAGEEKGLDLSKRIDNSMSQQP